MKTLVLVVVLSCLHVTSLSAKECRILTSQPDYTRMKLITADSIWQSLLKLAGKKMKYVDENAEKMRENAGHPSFIVT